MGSVRKIALLVAMVAAAIAVAAPAAASANKLVYANGQGVAEGASLSLKSDNMRTWGPAGQGGCNVVTMPAEAIANTATSAEAKGTGPGSAEQCYSRTLPSSFTIQLINLKFTGSTTGTIGLKLTQDWGWGAICKREGTLPMTFTPGTSVFHVNASFPGQRCLTEGMTGDFSLQAVYPFPGESIIIN